MEKDYQGMNTQIFFENRNKKETMSNWLFVILIIMYTFAYNDDLRNQTLVWYAISGFTIAYLTFMIAFSSYKKQPIGVYAIWASAFFAYTFLSGLWTINESEYFSKIKSLFLLFVVNILLSFTVETKKDIQRILLVNFSALVFYLAYILLKVDFSQLGEDRLGVDLLGSRWNANDVGVKLCIGFALAIYFSFERKNILEKIVLFIAAGIFAGVSFLSGSRTAFLLLILIGVGMLFLNAKNKILATGIIAVFVVGMYLLVMNVEPLYNVLGERLESLIINLMGGDTAEGSFDTRAEMIKVGWKAFLERPIFGYGLGGSFLIYEEALNTYTYAHNNFIETLLNGGLVGFLIYYFIYGYVFVKMLHAAFFKRDKMAIFLFVANVALCIMQISAISYTHTLYNCMLMLAVFYTMIRRTEDAL